MANWPHSFCIALLDGLFTKSHCLQIPAFGVSPLFATVLPVGFAGGHGTAGGLTPTYKAVSYPDEIINYSKNTP